MALNFLNDGYFAGTVGIGTESPLKKLSINGGDVAVNNGNSFIVGAAITGNSQIGELGADSGQLQLLTESTRDIKFGSTTYGNIMFLEGTNGYVGIGTTTPLTPLDVVGMARMDEGITESTHYIGTAIEHWGNGGTGLHFPANDTITLKTSSSERIRITSAGNVGIGTTSPGLKLDINSGTANSALRVLSTDRYTGIKFEDDTNNDTLFYDGQSDLMYLGSTNFRAVDLHATGNLRVQGAIYDSNNSPGTANQVLVSTVTGTDWVDGSAIPGVPAGSGTLNTVTMWTPDGDTLGDGPITFNGNNSTLLGIVQCNSELGVGSAPTNTFSILSGSGQVNMEFGTDSTSTFIQAYNRTNSVYGALRFVTNGETMRITNTGNVGINTTSPSYLLDVNGDARSKHFRDNTQGSGSTPATIGWYKIAKWDGSARGGSEIKISTTGGTYTPITWIIRCYKNWSGDATLKLEQYGYSNIYFTKVRVEYDNTAAVYYLEIYQSIATALAFNMYQTSLMGFNSNVSILTGALAAGTTGGTTRTELPFIAGGTSVEALTIGNSGNTGPFLPLAGGTMTGDLKLNDNVDLYIGTGNDFQAYHDGSNTYLRNLNGNFVIKQDKVDADLILESDDGSGGTTPYFQLDGSHTQSIAWKDIHFVDGVKAKFGDYANPDLEIYHDGSNSYIRDQGTGNLIITGSQLTFSNVADTEYMVKMVQDGTVELYYNGSKKLETTSAGVAVTGGVTASSTSTFLGNGAASLKWGDASEIGTLTFDTNADPVIRAESGKSLKFDTNGANNALTLNTSQNATFAGNVTVGGSFITINPTGNAILNVNGTADSFIEKDTGNDLYIANNVGDKDIKFRVKDNTTNVVALTIDGSEGGDATFAAQAFSAATSSGDGSSTLTTKGYVDSLITGATIYRGTWDPDVSLNSGYGNPNLNTVTQTSGYYYICSADGAATPNGATTEPNTWNTGDWVIWNDDIGTSGEWQKIDNSSVLSGVGTGQTVALWQGASSVTDSETLGNAPITVDSGVVNISGSLDINQTGDSNGIKIYGYDDRSAYSGNLYIDSAGNFQIRQTHGTGSGYIQIMAEEYLQLKANSLVYTDSVFRIYDAGRLDFGNSGDYRIQHNEAVGVDNLTIHTNDGDGIAIDNAGNVGIGTDSPTAKLQVAGTTTYNSDSAQALRVCDAADVSKGIHIGFDTTEDAGIIQSGDFGVSYRSLSLNPNSGNVGIGTTSPNNKLDVNGDVFINSNYTANVAAQDLTIGKTTTGNHGLTIVTGPTYTGSIYFGDSGNNDAGIIKYQHSNNSMQFVTNRSEAMRIDTSGNVGIGTTSPNAALSVLAANATAVKATRIGNDTTSIYYYATQVDAILAWTCGSYYQAEVVITASQTNGGDYNNLYIRGIWSNNHTSHHWDELEHVGFLTGSTFTMSVGQNGTTTNSGRLELDFNYISGSFAQLNVRVTDFYGSHSYTIT